MKLINGVFKDNEGNTIPPEFGNKEQIRLIKQLEIRHDNYTKGFPLDIRVDTNYSFKTSFTCVCGSEIYLEGESHNEEDALWELKEVKKSCRKCKKEYITKEVNDELIVKYQ